MSSDRLYYTDPYLVEFDAVVREVVPQKDRWKIVLDRTAFYPTSGGQPFDTGTIDEAIVIDVFDQEDGTIGHLVDRPLDTNSRVRGHVDWARRFDHMQQHSGQHVLSAAFDRIAGARTESFHLGSASSTIDLDRTMTPADIERAEDEANRIVWEDRPVVIRFASAEEALKLPLRKESGRTGELRLVDMIDFDISACGGTHVARTGAIGNVAVASSERFRGGTRVEFLCGIRTLRAYRALRDTTAASVRLVSVLPADLPAGIERLQGESKEVRRQVKDLQTRLAAFEGAALADRAEPQGSLRVVVAVLEGWDQNGLKAIASAIASRPAYVAALFSVPHPSAVVIARASDAAVDCSAVLKKVIERFGGKGGGRAELAQGGGLQGAPDDFISFARAALTSSAAA